MSKLNQQLQPQNNTAEIIWEELKMAKHFKLLGICIVNPEIIFYLK